MSHGSSRGRWASRLSRLRRGGPDDAPLADDAPESGRASTPAGASAGGARAQRPTQAAPKGAGWDFTARTGATPGVETPTPLPVRAQILAILADPRVDHITLDGCARLIARPRQDIETTLDAMVQAGELVVAGGSLEQYRLPVAEKQRLEAMFRSTAMELGEQVVLGDPTPADGGYDDEGDEPRLPVTAGLLSLFLPGTGQLLNGDVGRASLVFAVWSLAWITHLSPVWTFVCLYAGAEAFFTAKIRGMERKIAKEAITGNPDGARALGP